MGWIFGGLGVEELAVVKGELEGVRDRVLGLLGVVGLLGAVGDLG